MNIEEQYTDLDIELEKKKNELISEIMPIISKFIESNGIEVRSISVDCIDVTSFEQKAKRFVVGAIKINTKR